MAESQQLWLIPALPLLGFLINSTVGRKMSKQFVSFIAIASVVASFLWVAKTLNALGALEQPHVEHYFTWIASGTFSVGFDFSVDRLTSIMLLVVTGIGSLIHIYATGYMAHEGGYYRFFAYLNLFMFFMLILVLAANFLLLFVGWEGVGLCSYLLIGFYFLEKSAGDAGKKAFIVNRVGDFGFSLAMFLVFIHFGSLDFGTVFGKAATLQPEHSAGMITAICLLLLVGAAGKSAQIPLYVWLPDAMAGPTPVSALIHAATMVTAGVYMVCRSSSLFNNAPIAMETVAIVGTATAFFAATMGLAQNDIKKVFAYSTVSQLGYMFLGAGVGAYSAGIFHVVTHAFFKALLFLGAGSVIMACHHEQDMRWYGGLRKKIPVTFGTLCCAWVAIAGIPPFSGYHSKDAILLAAYEHARPLFWIGALTAAMTAFYVSRAMFLTFFGEYRGPNPHPDHGHGGHDDHAHGDDHAAHGHDAHAHKDHGHGHQEIKESPAVMTIPLVILALLSLGGGFLNIPDWLEPVLGSSHAEHDPTAVAVLYATFILGIGLAYVMYVLSPGLPDKLASSFKGLHTLIYNKYFVDEVYDVTIVHPITEGSRYFLWKGVDAGLIDGAVNGAGSVSRWIGGTFRHLQGGNIRSYATWVAAGAVFVILAMSVWGGVR
jgi:NADH-quinone oxidoreductase subunit L